MRVLLVGAAGNIGRRVVPLLASAFELQLADLKGGEVAGLSVQTVDVCDFDATLSLVRQSNADAIVNLAIADYSENQKDPTPEAARRYRDDMLDVNVRGACYLYEAAAHAGIGKFVFISSLSVVGCPRDEMLKGDEALRPVNLYACTKSFGELVGSVYAAQQRMSVTCLRLGQPYPLNTELEKERMAYPYYRRLIVHFEDIAQALGLALKETAAFAIYPIVSDNETPWVDQDANQMQGYKARYLCTSDGVRKKEKLQSAEVIPHGRIELFIVHDD